jgi:hypothetical protein
MTLDEFNGLSFEDAKAAMMNCCGCEAWAVEMAARRPYKILDDLLSEAETQWWQLGEYGWMEAFRAHPQPELPSHLQEIREVLREYYATFGFGFILESEKLRGDELVEAIRARVENLPEEEIEIAAEEEARMTRRRLKQFFA